MIGTDVKREFTQQTIDEVWKEIRLLQTEPVGDDELMTVKNYMAGEFVGSLNTPFEGLLFNLEQFATVRDALVGPPPSHPDEFDEHCQHPRDE